MLGEPSSPTQDRHRRRSLSEGRSKWEGCLRRLQRIFRFVGDWIAGFFSFGGFAHLATIACYVFQAICLDIFLIEYLSKWTMVVLIAEVPLVIHLLWYWRQENAAKAAPFQWFVYSWIHGAKVVVLFCKVMPELPTPTTEVVDGVGSFSLSGASLDDFFSSTTLANILLLTPVFYTLLMFRTGKAIFGSSSHRISVDLIMHYDMLWHVVIDMVDMVDMFHYARIAEWIEPAILSNYGLQLMTLQSVVPFLLFLSSVLHGQSLPGVFVDEWHLVDSTERSPGDSKRDSQQSARSSEVDEQTSMIAGVPSSRDSLPSSPQSRLHQLVKDFKGLGMRSSTRHSTTNSGESDVSSAHGSHIDSDVSEGAEDSADQSGAGSQPPLPPSAAPLRPSTVLGGRDSSLRPVVPPAELMLPDQALAAHEAQDEDHSALAASSTKVAGGLHSSLASTEPHQDSPPRNITFQPSQARDVSLRSEGSLHLRSKSGKAVGRRQSASNARAQERHLLNEKKRIKRAQAIIDLIQRHAVVIARKRSAIVSIFFVDMPFLCVRVSLWLLSIRAEAPHFPGLGAKNGVCFLLNTLQFTLVQMATSEGYAEIQRLLAEYRWHNRSHSHGHSPTNAGTVEGAEPSRLSATAGMESFATQRTSMTSVQSNRGSAVVTKTVGPSCSPAIDSEATPASVSASVGSTPQVMSSDKGSPHLRALQREREQRGIAEAEFEVRRETRRTTSICTHFWALAIAFGGGILLAQVSQNSAVESVIQWLDFTASARE